MNCHTVIAQLKKSSTNRNGFTFLTAMFMVMLIGVMLGLTGQSWKTIMQREREKELLFRGSQIKAAIENWYDPKTKFYGVPQPAPRPLMDLKDLLLNPNALTPMRYLPHNYANELDAKNSKCTTDCPKLKVYQDPLTGMEWTLIKGTVSPQGDVILNPGAPGIVGVASKSPETPFRTNFKDTVFDVFENSTTARSGFVNMTSSGKKKYSDWKFIAAPPSKNDHAKIYRAYHEGW